MSVEQSEPMRVEDEIDAALKMLGETQPPAAIVSRVHQRLETAAMSLRARSGRRLLIPAAGVAMAALAVLAILAQSHHKGRDQAPAVETARMVVNTPLAQATVTPPSATVETERADEGKRSVQFSTERRSHLNRENRHATNLLSYPLTRQEKLLLQFARSAKPADLQALDPEYQDKVEAQQEEEFAAYLKSGDDSSTQENAN
ncbi:MAG: hypothetical protein WCE63_18225 [Acidobacteriaceae bacterium]